MQIYDLRLKDLLGCKQPNKWNFSVERMYDGGPKDDDKSFCGSVLKAKNDLIIISAKYLNDTDAISFQTLQRPTLTIILFS